MIVGTVETTQHGIKLVVDTEQLAVDRVFQQVLRYGSKLGIIVYDRAALVAEL